MPDKLTRRKTGGRAKITKKDWINALRNAVTVPELAARLRCGEARVRKALKALAVQGRLEVIRIRRASLTGVPILIPGYRIKAAKPKKGARPPKGPHRGAG